MAKKVYLSKVKSMQGYDFTINSTAPERGKEYEEWGFAVLWVEKDGIQYSVEYNLSIDHYDGKRVDQSAIYKIEPTRLDGDPGATCFDEFEDCRLRFSDGWEQRLEDAMCRALVRLHELD